MSRSAFPKRMVGLVALIALLALIVVGPVGAVPVLYPRAQEPTARPTATPAPYVVLEPTQGVAGEETEVLATGALWAPDEQVTLYWDVVNGEPLGQTDAEADGTFELVFITPTDPGLATIGSHTVIAVQGELQAEAAFELVLATPTDTDTPTPTSTDTSTPTPTTPSPTPSTTPTPSPTLTSPPTATLRPVTPMVTITAIPPTRRPPAATRRPTATRTNTPIPGTPTQTLTPSVTPTPSQTPGPGTPAATPTPTPSDEMSDTGVGWGTLFLWGGLLAGLLVVFRFLRVRSLAG